VEVSASYLARAAVVLACADTDDAVDEVRQAVTKHTAAPVIAVRTKIDLSPLPTLARDAMAVSAETGQGLEQLLAEIQRVLSEQGGLLEVDAPVLTHTRQRYTVDRALDEAKLFREAWCDGGVPATVAAVHIRSAVGLLEELVGSIDVDDVLDEVFRRFCVGK
jgi:tRNA modification GTPase